MRCGENEERSHQMRCVSSSQNNDVCTGDSLRANIFDVSLDLVHGFQSFLPDSKVRRCCLFSIAVVEKKGRVTSLA